MALATSLDPDAYYTWHQNLAVIPLMIIMLLLSRFRSSELFSMHRIGLMVLIVICSGLILLSGKRAALAAIPLVFVAAAFIRKEYGFVLLWLGSAVVVLEHGRPAARLAFHVADGRAAIPFMAAGTLGCVPGQYGRRPG